MNINEFENGELLFNINYSYKQKTKTKKKEKNMIFKIL